MQLATDMRIENATLSAEVKQMRIEHRRARDRARRLRLKEHAEAGMAGLERAGIYRDWQDVKRTARLHHLTRMMLKGRDYHKVEAFTYHRVQVEELTEYAWSWWPGVTEEFVAEWLGQDVN